MAEQLDKNEQSAPITPENKGIPINGINYSYSITKSENEEEALIIKLSEQNHKSNMYFTYEAPVEKLSKEIKFLAICENLEEMIESLNEVFSQGNAQVEEKEGEYFLEFKISGFGIKKKCVIQLVKHEIEIPKEPKNELENGVTQQLENKFNDLYNKFEQLKKEKENILKEDNIKSLIKKVIFDEDIKKKLFEEMEQLFLSKYNLNNNNQNKKENFLENEIINKTENLVDIKEEKINQEIISMQNQIKENIEYLKDIKSNNYIALQVKIDENNRNKEVRLLNQVSTYKYFCNFERDDIEVICNNGIIPIYFKKREDDFTYNAESKNCEKSQITEYNLEQHYYYYLIFSTIGIYNIKIIFKKKLMTCKELFAYTDSIFKIDCSNFDCSQITDCSSMFRECSSLAEVNLGKLDFSLSTNFSFMFYSCKNLEKLDVSNFNTENSMTFKSMFHGCFKLKEINASKFKTKACNNIEKMFYQCKDLQEIDIFNWDLRDTNIKNLFSFCSNLKNIKMNFSDNFLPEKYIYSFIGFINNEKDDESLKEVFKGLPDGGLFVWKKGLNCNALLKYLPVSWNRTQE